MQEKRSNYFTNLDGLRFVAFFMVFFQHAFSGIFKFSFFGKHIVNSFYVNFFNGGTGVSFFFVLSGFLISWLLINEKKYTGRINILNFYLRRILRIWPLYYLLLVLVFLIIPIIKHRLSINDSFQNQQVFYWFFLSNFDVLSLLVKNLKFLDTVTITWSVAIEEQFYLLWPLFFFITSSKKYYLIFLSVILISILFRLLNANNGWVLYFHSISVFSDLAVGGILAYIATNKANFLNSFFQRISRREIILIYIFCFLWFLIIKTHIPNVYINSSLRLIDVSLFAFVIAEQNFAKNSFFKMSNFKILSQMGKYTYGLYLLHPLALFIVEFLFVKIFHITEVQIYHIILKGFVGLILSLIMAITSYHFYEMPFLKLKEKFSIKIF